ncbi:hypothetical protein EDD85DRAFT_285406 [Armillaria nabsnona]|nr:hypothetical protein EDD85DRAFT_285406 [Armillaria nabsnona]
MPRLRWQEVIKATTNNPWTTNFRHLMQVDRSWLKRKAAEADQRKAKVVHSANRIKYWNIVPGDQIRIRGDRSDTLHSVHAINKLSNQVFLKPTEGDQEGGTRGKNYHYSRCQLFVGDYEFPPEPGSIEAQTRRVFALRIGTSKPIWSTYLKRFHWNRYAVKTTPSVPQLRGKRVPIPWPVREEPKYAEPSAYYDTPKDEVMKVTYQPPPFNTSHRSYLPPAPSESEYLFAMFNIGLSTTYGDTQPPAELYLEKELTNPHSFAKRHERWKAYQAYKKTLLAEMVQKEQKHLFGRTKEQAKADATFKWKERLELERRDKVAMRQSFANLKQERKARRKARKDTKIRQRLTDMVLSDAVNQIVPKEINA